MLFKDDIFCFVSEELQELAGGEVIVLFLEVRSAPRGQDLRFQLVLDLMDLLVVQPGRNVTFFVET